ncbi:hypothetical protein [Streptomyces sp. NPDC101145]
MVLVVLVVRWCWWCSVALRCRCSVVLVALGRAVVLSGAVVP